MELHEFVQVPVINKTESIFKRDPINPRILTHELADNFKILVHSEPYIVSVKTDGTCGIICKMFDGSYLLMRRQDIRVKSRNYNGIMSKGENVVIANVPCYISEIRRGSGKSEIKAPIYIYQLTSDGKPEIENNHIIGFTPLLHDFGEDKYAITAISGTNGSIDMKLCTTIFNGTMDIQIQMISVSELMNNMTLMTVEILGSKISNKYGFTDNKHIINPHGSIVYPKDEIPPFDDYNRLKNWFESDDKNRWANVEGFVIHFPVSNCRFKIHRGHVGLEKTWQQKKESGLKFIC